MTDEGKKPPHVRAYLRRLGNPYACEQVEEDAVVSATQTRANEARELFSQSENPHAWHYYMETEDAPVEAAAPAQSSTRAHPRRALSKAEFEEECRTIFRRYMPVPERRQLRVHHREFIERNRRRSPQARYGLVEALKRYDLAGEAGLRTYFNREEETFTEEKLRAIEQSVKDE